MNTAVRCIPWSSQHPSSMRNHHTRRGESDSACKIRATKATPSNKGKEY